MEPQPHLLPHEKLFESGFIRLYSNDIVNRSGMTKEQLDELWNHLRAPVVQILLKELCNNIARDLLRLDFTRQEDQLKLAARYGQGRGALELVDTLINSTQQESTK